MTNAQYIIIYTVSGIGTQSQTSSFCDHIPDAMFDWILYVRVNNFSVMSRRVFLGWTSTKQGSMCLDQGHNAVTLARAEPAIPQSRVKHSVTESLRSCLTVYTLIAPLSDIYMVCITYFAMHKVHMHAGGIRQLLCVCAYVREIIHSLELVYYTCISPYVRTNHTITIDTICECPK